MKYDMGFGLLCFQFCLKQKKGKHRCYCCFQLGLLNDHLFGKELFILFTVRVFSRTFINLCVLFFDFEDGMCDLIVLIPDHCLSIYFLKQS